MTAKEFVLSEYPEAKCITVNKFYLCICFTEYTIPLFNISAYNSRAAWQMAKDIIEQSKTTNP